MSRIRFVLALVPLLACAPALAAQDSSWSRLTSRTNCPPAENCPSRPGLLWDSTNTVPSYPKIMKAVGISGHVEIRFAVDTNGHVDRATVRVDSSTNAAFEPGTVEAAGTWRFDFSPAPGHPTEPIQMRIRLVYAIAQGCHGGAEMHTWGDLGTRPDLIVVVCEPKLIPRNQIRPMNRPD